MAAAEQCWKRGLFFMSITKTLTARLWLVVHYYTSRGGWKQLQRGTPSSRRSLEDEERERERERERETKREREREEEDNCHGVIEGPTCDWCIDESYRTRVTMIQQKKRGRLIYNYAGKCLLTKMRHDGICNIV